MTKEFTSIVTVEFAYNNRVAESKEEYIELLDKLCTRNRRKKNEMIEILIEDACEKLGITKKPPRM